MALVSIHIKHKNGEITVDEEWKETLEGSDHVELRDHLESVKEKVLKAYGEPTRLNTTLGYGK